MRSSLSLLCLQAVLLIQTTDSSVLDGLVSTPWGKIQGVPRTSPSGPNHTSFEGIPYAKPPLGNLRFSKPVPSTGSQNTVLMADAVKPSCLMNNMTRESEDCLYLDLYVPHSNSKESSPLPVMVFIHGGGFLMYTSDVTPDRLLAKNVIVALVHYRLGAMGFLSTGDDVLKGNYGLWDQRMAIQWVKDNVAAFGGNPNSITVFGVSAGAASVGYQILAPKAGDLFQRAILHSGSANSGWTLSREPAKTAKQLGQRFKCPWDSYSADLAKCLRSIDGVRLQQEVWNTWMSLPPYEMVMDFVFVPVVDHEFVLDEPWELLKNHSYLHSFGAFEIDVMIGIVNNESITVTANPAIPKAPEFGDVFHNNMLPFMLRQRYGVSTSKAVEAVGRFYSLDISRTSLTKPMISDMISDFLFAIPGDEFVATLAESKTGSSRYYFYYFDYCPSFSQEMCMGHGSDQLFLFTVPLQPLNFTSTDEQVSDIYSSLLTTFAKTGIPEALNAPTWPQYSPETKSYLEISAKPQVKQNFVSNRSEFWSTFLPSTLPKPNQSTRLHHCSISWTSYLYYSVYCVIILMVVKFT